MEKIKVNYDKKLQQEIKSWTYRPQLLIHICCAPCATYTLEYLTKHAEVTIYFANSNIHPEAEYLRRVTEVKRFVKLFNRDFNQAVKFIEAPYQPSEFRQLVQAGNLAAEKEGGARCRECFKYRLDIVAAKALELNFDYFGSALTISPHKDSQLINELGFELANLYAVKYLPSDFKKNNGYQRASQLCQQYDIYRQCYCGCVYSAQEHHVDLAQIKAAALAYLANQE